MSWQFLYGPYAAAGHSAGFGPCTAFITHLHQAHATAQWRHFKAVDSRAAAASAGLQGRVAGAQQ